MRAVSRALESASSEPLWRLACRGVPVTTIGYNHREFSQSTRNDGALCENLGGVSRSGPMSSETRVAHACYVLIASRVTASSPAVVVLIDMLAQ